MKVAVMGYGTVGSGVVEVIEHHSDIIPKRTGGKTLEISHILDLRDFPNDAHKDLFTKDFNDILNDEETKIVAETMGGVNPAFDFTMKLLKAGKSVVTSNKELVAQRGLELLQAAEESGANYLFEASVGGGIPIIRPLCQCLAANYIEGIAGILNGTTNFILTMMIEKGMSFDEALKIAQEKGYAEKDPTADVEGYDACRKVCILASLAFGKHVYPNQVETEGITNITLEDVSYIENAGTLTITSNATLYDGDNCTVKLTDENGLGIANKTVNVTLTNENGSKSNFEYITDGDGLISFNITGIGNYSIGCVFDGDRDYKSTNVTQNVSVIANVVQDGNNGFKDTSNQKSSSSQSNYYEDDHLSCEQLKAKYPEMSDGELFERFGERGDNGIMYNGKHVWEDRGDGRTYSGHPI